MRRGAPGWYFHGRGKGRERGSFSDGEVFVSLLGDANEGEELEDDKVDLKESDESCRMYDLGSVSKGCCCCCCCCGGCGGGSGSDDVGGGDARDDDVGGALRSTVEVDVGVVVASGVET